MDQLPRLGKRELICLLLFTCNYVVSVWRGFLVCMTVIPSKSYIYIWFPYKARWPTFLLTLRSFEPRHEKTNVLHICVNKDDDQLRDDCEADQRLCFLYIDSTIPRFSISEISSL